jgi:hypothetical protein
MHNSEIVLIFYIEMSEALQLGGLRFMTFSSAAPLTSFAINPYFFYMSPVPAAVWWFCRLCKYVTSLSLKFFLVFLKDRLLGPCYLTYLLMICAVLFNTRDMFIC